eukprot:1785588-Prymnesium_polylepis.1
MVDESMRWDTASRMRTNESFVRSEKSRRERGSRHTAMGVSPRVYLTGCRLSRIGGDTGSAVP